MPAYGLGEIEAGRTLQSEPGLEDLPRFLFHGPAVTGGPYAEPGFDSVVQAAYRDTCHTSMIALQSLLSFLESGPNQTCSNSIWPRWCARTYLIASIDWSAINAASRLFPTEHSPNRQRQQTTNLPDRYGPNELKHCLAQLESPRSKSLKEEDQRGCGEQRSIGSKKKPDDLFLEMKLVVGRGLRDPVLYSERDRLGR
jgi:hypothetical protein